MTRSDAAALVVKAPLARVFEAMIDPQALVEWLPPSGMAGRFEHFDARPGGSYRMVLTYLDPPAGGGKSDPDSDVVEARFLEIESEERVVQAVEFASADPSFDGTMTMTWTVSRVDGGTLVEFRADGVPPGISAADHRDGMTSSLRNLAAYLARRQTTFRGC
ncbi:SRPBCC domain-containing protein [Mycobacterium sp. IDR2000157661]|uniref:SRPBCC domain-containing protein n=1 Tax=Mycobacterium sp. IDR2000157661 TaxID=2867005 RepID=UPI001EEACC7E|nr:SRPBCC domain-containing protein [Mycobacterium sp. IDR2000157661]ULE31402.1 SRPBCC domain-containing protein [Mycobacterium sp. IDR2000157661]